MKIPLLVALLAASADASPLSSLVADYETGPLRIFRNDGRYGAEGTSYDAADVGQARNLYPAQRLAVELGFGDRHTAILLYAPLDVTTRVTLEDPLVFRDTRFDAGSVVTHRYLFDGYRGSYLYQVVRGGPFKLGIGASFQVRNAAVEFFSSQPDRYATENDIGLVFALKFRARYDSPWGLYGVLEADGLTTAGLIGDVTGGILDTSLTLGFPVAREADLFLRLRLLGGGADVPDREIYNWGWFGAALIGARVDFVELLARRPR